MKLTGTATVMLSLTATAAVVLLITGTGSVRTLSPTASVCPEITGIDGGFPDTEYTPVFGLINGGTP